MTVVMALHLQTCGDLSLGHDALWVVVRPPPPWEKKKKARPTWRAVVRVQTSLGNELTNEAMWRVSLSDSTKEWPVNFAAAPRYSSLLRMGGRRRYEAKMKTRDRVLMTIADWVFLRVKDPLVEVDPFTVKTVILKEQEAEGLTEGLEDETVTSTSATGIFAYLPPGFPRGAKGAALLAGIFLLIAALGTAAILALRGKNKSEALPHELDGSGPAQNGGAREDLDDGSTDLRDEIKTFPGTENGDGEIKRSPVVTPTSFQGFHPPVTSPSSVAFKDEIAHSHSTSNDGSESPHSETDLTLVLAEEIIGSSSNGSTTRKSPVEHSVKEEIVDSVVLIEEISTAKKSSERPEALNGEEYVLFGDSESLITVAELATLADPIAALPAVANVAVPADSLLTEVSSLGKEEIVDFVVLIEEISTAKKSSERPEALNGEEYVLFGDSESLITVAELATLADPIAALPAVANVAVPADSLLTEVSSSQEGLESILLEDPDSQPSIEANLTEIDAEAVVERQKEYTEILKKVLPAVSVGAGAAALSTLSGVDGALQMVGLLATASFITQDIMWAGRRQQLLEELCSIKDHKQFIEFLKGRNVIPDRWN